MFNPDHDASPFNALPTAVVILAMLIVAVELVIQAGAVGLAGGAAGIGWRVWAIETFGFFDAAFEWMLVNRTFRPDYAWRLLTFPFVHEALIHAGFACVLLLAIGKFVGERFSAAGVVAIFFVSAIVGAVAYSLFLDQNRQLTGAYPAIYGLLGAFTWTLWTAAEAPAAKVQAFQLIGLLMGLQLLFQLIGAGGYEWVADLAGFVTGFVACFVLAPGAAREILRRSRHRR